MILGRALLALALLAAAPAGAVAEVATVNIARQYGLGFLPLMVMEHDQLLEKHARALGSDAKANWAQFGGPAAMNEALLSGSVDFIANGSPALLTMWARTRGTPQEVMGVASMTTLSMVLVAREPRLKALKDFTDDDRIAVTAIKVSIPSILMQMVAARDLGLANYQRYEQICVSLPHPDAMVALLNRRSEIVAHFTSPPYIAAELKQPGMHKVLASEDVMGGPSSFSMLLGTSKFRRDNPKAFRALFDGYAEAVALINRDKPAAAKIYLALANDKRSTEQDILDQLNDPAIVFTMVPQKVMTFATFMADIGAIKARPAQWTDLFFPELHGQPGS
jgi:NitT/TauT family transport system substrate-binding protein